MADKFRVSFPISITFTSGEMPTASKMTSLAKQARRGLSLIEYAVGDIWNQGGDSILAKVSETADEPLMIANIGRYLGSSRLANPRIPALPDITHYTHNLYNEEGTHEARLPFPPAAGSTWSWTGTGCPTGAPQTLKSDVDADYEWWIDTTTSHPGDVYFYNAVQTDWELTYKPSVVGDIDSNATWNIIPDPDTDSSCGFQGLKLEYVNGADGTQGYKIFLPPRQPLNLRKLDQSPQDNIHSPTQANTHNQTTTPADANLTFWQDGSGSVDGVALASANSSHYRYTLPKIITNNWGNSSTIPAGLVYLWDPRGTGTIIEGVVFAAEAATTPNPSYLVATGSNLTAWLSTTQGLAAYSDANLKLTTHGATLYPANGLRLVTVGTSVAQLASATHQQYMDHDHSSEGSMAGKPVAHSKLSGLDGQWGSPYLTPSAIRGDDHSCYLERHGYNAGRDKHKNMLLGDLVLSSTVVGGASDYENVNADSQKLVFGMTDSNGSQIYLKYLTGNLDITTPLGLDINTSGAGSITLKNSLYGYKVDERTDIITMILQSAVPGDGGWPISTALGWGVGIFAGNWCYYTSYATANNTGTINFFISDFPTDCKISNIKLQMLQQNPATTTISIYRENWTIPGGRSNWYTGTENGTGWHTFDITTGDDSLVWERDKHIMRIELICNGAGYRGIAPWIKASCIYSGINPYQPAA